MKFFVLDNGIFPSQGKSQAFLVRENWDDWFSFETQYSLVIFDGEGNLHWPGKLKIGQQGLRAGGVPDASHPTRRPVLPVEFTELDPNFFSIGQEDNYYESLNQLGDVVRREVLTALRDCALDLSIFERYKAESVMQQSLLRYLTIENVYHRLHRLANGNAALTRYHFDYVFPVQEDIPPARMSFLVTPGAEPPTNVHVLVGRNGVGKSRCIQGLTGTVLELEETPELRKGQLVKLGSNSDEWSFAGLVHVSFSAFDSFAFPPTATQNKIRGTFVGLSNLFLTSENASSSSTLKELLAKQFVVSFESCRTGLRARRWREAVKTLTSDPMFEEANVEELLDLADGWEVEALWLFKRLSSGHAIVLLSITRLVELVDERTLVVLDEPEGHLHPPLLSAFIRAVSNLLVERNGVAIIATHSPVVLQEVPATCVSILSRSGAYSSINPPEIETFGEAVGVLTREVFGLEVTDSGFHALIRQQVDKDLSFEAIIQHFNNQLGNEARLLARSLVAARDRANGVQQ